MPEVIGQLQQQAFQPFDRCEGTTTKGQSFGVEAIHGFFGIEAIDALAQQLLCLQIAHTDMLGDLRCGVPGDVVRAVADADVVLVSIYRQMVVDSRYGCLFDGKSCRVGLFHQLADAELNIDQQPF